jgi:WD40 repeat protein
MYHKGAIESYPLQTYTSALLFSPTQSLVKQLFQHEEPDQCTVTPPMSDNWSACLQTLEGHSSMVSSMAFSHDSAMLASTSYKTVNIWDAASGARLQTLTGHAGDVSSVTFARNSTKLASVSSDTVKIWDASSGACLKTFEGHKNVAFSHDLAIMASAPYNTIEIWESSEVGKGACLKAIDDGVGAVSFMTFSHDSAKLATTAWATIKIWDRKSGALLLSSSGHNDRITSMVFSHDSTILASSSEDHDVIIWDASRGTLLQTLEGHSDRVTSVTFSNDSAILASSSYDRTIKIWDTNTGACMQTLKGHSDRVTTLSFARDSTRLASGSHDTTVKIWDVSSSAKSEKPRGHNFAITAIAFSHDSKQLASGSFDSTIKIWEVGSGNGNRKCLHTLRGHGNIVISLTFSRDSTKLASGSYDTTVRIWDTNSGTCLRTLNGGHGEVITGLAFSHDANILASASIDSLELWDVENTNCYLSTLQNKDITSLSFSQDSKRLAVGMYDGTIAIWNAEVQAHMSEDGTSKPKAKFHTGTGLRAGRLAYVYGDDACIRKLKLDTGKIAHLAFSPRADILAAVSRVAVEQWDADNEACRDTIQFWEVESAQCIRTIDTGRMLGYICFDDLGTYLHTSAGRFAVDVEHVVDLESELFSPISLRAGGTWINYKGRNRLWIPSEYRPLYWCISGRVVAVGDAIGRVWWCRFRDE